ncbi:hypothetical protein RB195_015366 [Necator americanus]
MCITIDVGVVIPRGNVSYAGSIAYETSAAALEIGREEVLRQQLLDGHDFRFLFASSNCSDVQAVGSAAKLILEQKIFALIGPACNLAAVATAPLSTYFNVPTYVWGLTTSSAINIKKYPSVITMTTTGSHSMERKSWFLLTAKISCETVTNRECSSAVHQEEMHTYMCAI